MNPEGSESSPSDDFSVDVDGPEGGHARVTATGAVDMVTAPELDRAIARAQELAPAVQLDLSGVEFLGSAGLSVLVDATRRAAGAGGRFAIVANQHVVLRAIEVTGLDKVLNVFPDPAAAVAYLSEEAATG